MHDSDITAYLGPAAAEATDEQRDRLGTALDQVAEIYTDADDQQAEAEAAGAGAAQIILGDDTLEGLATAWQTARNVEHRARYELHGAIIAAIQDGMSESEAVRVSGISRPTVRRLLGK